LRSAGPICAFANIAAILAEDGMTLADVVRVNAWGDRFACILPGYMKSRDKQFPGTPAGFDTHDRDGIRTAGICGRDRSRRGGRSDAPRRPLSAPRTRVSPA